MASERIRTLCNLKILLLRDDISEEVVEKDTNAKETVFPNKGSLSLVEVPPNIEAKLIVITLLYASRSFI